MSDFRKALLWTVAVTAGLPFVSLVVSAILPRAGGSPAAVLINYGLASPARILPIVALLVATVFYFADRRQVAKGIAIGAGIGFVAGLLITFGGFSLMSR